MLRKLRTQIASIQKLQKAKSIIQFEVTGLRLNLRKKIRRLFLRAENFAALRGIRIRRSPRPSDLRLSPLGEQVEELFFSNGKSLDCGVESSVIIPVFNKADLTIKCLRALSKNVDMSKFEVIVVDNASADDTQILLGSLGDKIKYIRNESNLGFVEACNIGAYAARGEYLIFLNNDTVVQPGWYEALVDTISADPEVGAVGSMLIFPNGTIQEAGGIIWSDAGCYAYGRGEDPDEDKFNFAREVDYCSAASLLIRRSLFEKIGGFDMRYAPAYYEDTDLCMAVRKKGFKVIFQPRSKVVHFEGATAGKSTASGFKRFQEINKVKFAEKWQLTLSAQHSSPDESKALQYSNRKAGSDILVFCDGLPRPLEAAGSVRFFAILRCLTQIGRVTLVHLNPESDDSIKRPLTDLGIELVWMPEFRERFRNGRCDIAILCYPLVANVVYGKVKRYFPNAKTFFDTVDLHHVRYRREYELSGDPHLKFLSDQFETIERNIADKVDQVWCITNEEKDEVLRIVPDAKVLIIPIIQEIHGAGAAFAQRKDLLFIGSFLHRPNLDSIEYFLKDIFPRILQNDASIRLNIVGSNMPPSLVSLARDNVIVHGFVEDPTELFEHSRVFISPLRFGAGMKGKIAHAMSYGLPVVTTSIGAEGFEMRDCVDGMIADKPDEFAAAVLRAYFEEELWNTLSFNGLEAVRSRCSTEVVSEQIRDAIGELLAPSSIK